MSYKSQDEQYLTFLTVAVPLLSSVEGKRKRRKCHEQPELPSRSATSVWPNVHSSRIRDTWEFFSDFLSPNDLLAKYSGFYFYLSGIGDFIELVFFTFPHVSVFI